jgi:hypothetical protein
MAIVVSTVVGTGVAAGAAGWEHPATRARMTHKISADVIVRIFFIPMISTGGYLRISHFGRICFLNCEKKRRKLK